MRKWRECEFMRIANKHQKLGISPGDLTTTLREIHKSKNQEYTIGYNKKQKLGRNLIFYSSKICSR